ncbi:unnamed protein product [Arctia plantaginis]|uniref:Uncharacterized protein n=1 Tax=Arctia plantaginis TaxID=874455 RepID=A0A8S1BP85_ARCPL|nr:unnamed protein product [Arctia plantaginis]
MRKSRAEYMRIYRQKKREEKLKHSKVELKRMPRSSTQRSRDFRARSRAALSILPKTSVADPSPTAAPIVVNHENIQVPLIIIKECSNSSEPNEGSSRSEITCPDVVRPHTGLVALPKVVLSPSSNSRSLLVGHPQNIHEYPNSSEPNGGPSSVSEITCPDVVRPRLVTLPQVVLSPSSNSRSLLVGHPQNTHVVEASRNLTPLHRDLSDGTIYLPAVGETSGRLTMSDRDWSDRPIHLPPANEIITSVYHYLQTEYEYLKSYIGSNCDLTPLGNILNRTAEATGVSAQTVTSLLENGKRALGSTHNTVQGKRAKSSHYSSYEDEDVSPNEEESSCEDLPEGHHVAFGLQQQSSHQFETLQVEFEEDEDHRNAVNERMWVNVEATPSESTAGSQSLLSTTPNVKIEPLNPEYEQTSSAVQYEPPSEHVEIKQEPSDTEYWHQNEQGSEELERLKMEFEEEEDEDHRNALRKRRLEIEATTCELNKAPKTSAERGREFRARKALLRQLRKQQQEADAIIENSDGSSEDNQVPGPSEIRKIEKRSRAAEATRRWREKKRGFSESSKKQAKTAAQRMREYRQRKKLKNSKSKERQQRYREKNREKLKRNQAERRNRKRRLQSIAESSASSNINRIELINKEITDGNSQSSSGLEGTETSTIYKQIKEKDALQRKRERQRRYREQNREKLKKREAERRQRLLNSDRDSRGARRRSSVHHEPPSEHVEIKQEPSDTEYWQSTTHRIRYIGVFATQNGRSALRTGPSVHRKSLIILALFISSVQSDVSDVSDNEENTLKVSASGSSTTLPKDTPSKIEASLPEAKDIIASVYHYLQTEYENLKSYTGGSCDFSPLANILKRTAAATGVSEQTVTAVIQDSKQSEKSTFDPVPSKRAKLSHDIKHECVSPIKEMSRCGSAKDGEHPDSGSQFDVEEHPLQTLKVEVHDSDEHHSVGSHEFWLKIETSSTQKDRAKHQSLPPTVPTRTEVKQEPVDVEDHEQLEGGDAVEDTASVEPRISDTVFSSVSTTQAERRPD